MSKTVIVSGGMSVLGQAYAERLTEEGYRVLALDIGGLKPTGETFGEYLECDKYKKLYEEEKQKYKDLKTWTEKLILSNTELLDQVKEFKNK